VYDEGVVWYESLSATGKVDLREGSHSELLDRMANVRRRRPLSLSELRKLLPSKRSIARMTRELAELEHRAQLESEARRFTDAYLDGEKET
jgi:RNase adaptor protein for sRNA GlmZ degradation